MSRSDLEALVEATCTLKRLQETPDPPEALATIPTLALDDLPRRNKVIPIEVTRVADTQVLYHDLATNGVLYLDLAFDLHVLPADLLPYVPLFARALLETGAGQQDFVSLSQRIGRTTGGIRPQVWISAVLDSQFAAARLFLRAKAVPEKGGRAPGNSTRCASWGASRQPGTPAAAGSGGESIEGILPSARWIAFRRHAAPRKPP